MVLGAVLVSMHVAHSLSQVLQVSENACMKSRVTVTLRRHHKIAEALFDFDLLNDPKSLKVFNMILSNSTPTLRL
jgi:hypothetical protein